MSYPYPDDDRAEASEGGREAIWKRGLIMLLFMMGFGLAQSVLFAIAVVQFFWMLIKRERNIFLADFGHSLALWLAETAWFLSADTEEKPFPWKPWPAMSGD
jgi:hypothetical protein